MLRSVVLLCGLGLGLAGPVLAHPHVFIDAEIEAIMSPGGLVDAIRITWTYDEFYTLMILEERGLDKDADGNLTEEETASIQGFDMQWQAGYPGDTYVLLDEVPQEISGPSDWTARVEDGFVITTHVRRLAVPLRPGADKPLIIQSYDPTYYIAYTVNTGTVADPDCEAIVHGFDPAMADAALTAASQEYAASTDPNLPFPKIGAAYADEVWVSCL